MVTGSLEKVCGEKGEPKPRVPVGGNLADETSRWASVTVWIRGTMMPWAPVSRAPGKGGGEELVGWVGEREGIYVLPSRVRWRGCGQWGRRLRGLWPRLLRAFGRLGEESEGFSELRLELEGGREGGSCTVNVAVFTVNADPVDS